MKKPKEENFALVKVRRAKSGGLDVHYIVTTEENGVVEKQKCHTELTNYPHKDFNDALAEYDSILKELYRCGQDEVYAVGASISGKDDSEGVVINGLYEFANLKTSSVVTPKIFLNGEEYGFEALVKNVWLRLEVEVYDYLYNDKKAELTQW